MRFEDALGAEGREIHDRVDDRLPGDVRIVVVADGSERLVYPSRFWPVYAVPALGRRFSRRLTRGLDFDGVAVRRV